MKEKSSSIAASILSLACTLAGLSVYTRLSKWWHFILAACSIVILYFMLYLTVELIKKIHFEYFARADISSDDNEDLKRLNQNNIELFFYDNLYEQCNDEESKVALRESIRVLCKNQENKIKWIQTKATNNTIRKPIKLPHEDFLVPYLIYCEKMKHKYKD